MTTAPVETVRKNTPAGAIRLNLGGIGDSGKTQVLSGFLIVDLQDDPLTDVRADISDLSMFEDRTVSEIYASNCLEHFPHVDTVKVLKEWRRVLTPGGILWISVPDMDAAFKLYQQYGLVPWIVNLLWGDQVHPKAFHYINFTWATLARAVNKAGFSDIQRVDQMPFGLKDASTHRDSINQMPVALNVKAIA